MRTVNPLLSLKPPPPPTSPTSPLFVSTINYHYHLFLSIYSLSSNSLMRPLGWGGVRDGNAGLAGIPVTFFFSQLSVLVTFSFSYNTLFLSTVGFMITQYKH